MEKVKIYAVYDGKIYEAEARETKKMYIVDSYVGSSWEAFGYMSNFYKGDIHLTALDALEDGIAKTQNRLDMYKRTTNTVKSELKQLKKLKKDIDTAPHNKRRM